MSIAHSPSLPHLPVPSPPPATPRSKGRYKVFTYLGNKQGRLLDKAIESARDKVGDNLEQLHAFLLAAAERVNPSRKRERSTDPVKPTTIHSRVTDAECADLKRLRYHFLKEDKGREADSVLYYW